MVVVQAIISLITRSAGTILNAIFEWCVIALFGRTSRRQQTLLSVVVAVAAAGPRLELALYPNDLLVRDEKSIMAWAHGLLAEDLVGGPGLQTYDAAAQYIELRIKKLWQRSIEQSSGRADDAEIRSEFADIVKRAG